MEILVEPAAPVVEGRLLDRPNRFRATVELAGRPVAAHVPNPGRMRELMQAGRRVHLAPAAGPARVTGYDLLALEHEGRWVCVDNRLGGRLARLALEARAIAGLPAYERVEAEVTVGRSRLDFRLTGAVVCWVESKSCTLVIDGLGRFPDAPTARGARHLEELIELRRQGAEAAVLFVCQRPDPVAVAPHRTTDPLFAETLARAGAAGVRLLAVTASWSAGGLRLGAMIPVWPAA